jgi:tetratricopeptide (TPR) repeat protein
VLRSRLEDKISELGGSVPPNVRSLHFYYLGQISEFFDIDFLAAQGNYQQALSLDPDSDVTRAAMARIDKRLGHFARADAEFERAVTHLAPGRYVEAAEIIDLYQEWAGLYQLQGDYDKADEKFKYAEDLLGQLYHEPTDTSRFEVALATFYWKRGQVDKAGAAFDRAEKVVDGKLDTAAQLALADAHATRASMYVDYDVMDKPESLYRNAEDIRGSLIRPSLFDPLLGDLWNDMGVYYRKAGSYQEAEKYLRKSFNIFSEVLGDLHPNYAASLLNQAILACRQRNVTLGLTLAKRAHGIYSEIFANNHPQISNALLVVAYLERLSGDLRSAELDYTATIGAMQRYSETTKPTDLAIALSSFGSFQLELGNANTAEKLLSEALKVEASSQLMANDLPKFTLGLYAITLRKLGRNDEANSSVAKAEALQGKPVMYCAQ